MTNNKPVAKSLQMIYVVSANGIDRECGTEIEASMLAQLLGGSFFVVWS